MRLIDADAIFPNGCVTVWECDGAMTADGILKAIKDAPTIDAVPVVRCGECIHRVRESWAKCTGRRPDEFCSDGERRFKDATD